MGNHQIIVRPHKFVFIDTWVCFCLGDERNSAGCETEEEGDTPRSEGEWKPLFMLFGNNHWAELVPAAESQMVPITAVPCLLNREGRGRSRVACGTGKQCLMWMMCHINTNHTRITFTAKLDPRSSFTMQPLSISSCLALSLCHYQRRSINGILNAESEPEISFQLTNSVCCLTLQ